MLGSDLAKVLSGSHLLFGLGRKKRSFGGKVQYVSCDLLDTAHLEKCVKRISPDIVIHSAAKTQVDDCELDPYEAYLGNVLATQFLIKTVKPYRPRFIYISTDYVFDGKKRGPYLETDVPAPLNVYGATKLLGEDVVHGSGLPYVIVRTSWLYGLNGPNFVATILKISREKNVLKVVTDQQGCPTYTKDLAEAIEKIINAKNVFGIFNVTNSGATNWNAYAKLILSESGVNHTKVLNIKTNDLDRPALRPRNSVLSNVKFEKRFGCKIRNWRLALRDYLKEFQKK